MNNDAILHALRKYIEEHLGSMEDVATDTGATKEHEINLVATAYHEEWPGTMWVDLEIDGLHTVQVTIKMDLEGL